MLAGRSFPAGTLTISIGVAFGAWPRDTTADATADARAGESLFRAADKALYAAKRRGRNQVFVVPEPGDTQAAVAVERR